jgi:hypothetical protein
VAGANAYVSLAEFKSWASAALKDLTGKTDPQIEAAIVAASTHADLRFAYKGYRSSPSQLGEFPREDLWDDRGDRVVGVPPLFKQGVCHYAFLALSRDLWTNPEQDDTGLTVKRRSEKVGPVEETVEYGEHSGGSMPNYPVADRLISARGIVRASGTSGLSVGTTARA